ncbi:MULTISPECIES: hypothetical protein [unclassified Streptomyces]|uniref:hypothetical protein n=1 Tax=unclassified Streptomyces TaxID=2593676 RepID=UPI00081E69A4|nr:MULTISPECIES: hypothetical protein [unclassified Streptomyces]MYZ38167.1 hypothetical protein [Streptomyces sp. SID4917]SCF96763.1 hypothetical protein GA0115259_105904 [Streptomyces sp. MnatMP-M17]
MAFGAEELRVLRRALAVALHPVPLPNEDVRACLRLAESVDEAVREAGRLRAFLVADLARYREALPGSLTGYLELLQDALAAGYVPVPDDLAALRALRGNPVAAALLDRCQRLAERSVRARLAARSTAAAGAVAALTPAPRTRLLALPGGLASDEPEQPKEPREPRPAEPKEPREPRDPDVKDPEKEPREPKRPRKPAQPQHPAPGRPMPKPSEVFPPRRRPAPPPEELAAG